MSVPGTTPSALADARTRDAVAAWGPSEHPSAQVRNADAWLARILWIIEAIDPSGPRWADGGPVAAELAYARRNELVYKALWLAHALGYRCGIKADPAEPDWPVIYIDLPDAGQVSWHMPAYPGEWDGHDTAEKYRRTMAYGS